jgi:hypothetical protein
MICYGFPWPRVPANSAKVSSWLKPFFNLVDQITSCAFSHTAEQDSQSITSLISKQVVSYQTQDDTCCPMVSTPKTRSLADLSMAHHISWRNPTVSTIPTYAQSTTSILTTVNDGWKTKTLNNNTRQTQHHKYGKTCTTLMIVSLNKTNQVWTHIPKVWGLGKNIKTCRPVCILERESI